MLAVKVSWDARQLADLGDDMLSVGRTVQEEMNVALDRSAELILNQAKRNLVASGAVAERKLINSLTITRAGNTRSVGTAAPHAEVVEKGKRAGTKMPPEGAIRGWMNIKGIDPKLEFVIRRSIGRNVQAPRPFLYPALNQTRRAVNREFVYMMARITRRTIFRRTGLRAR